MLIAIKKILIALLCITTSYISDGYKTGAPPLSCRTMTPSHGSSPQSSPPPYTISITEILNNGGVRVKLEANPSAQFFAGYLLRARLLSSDAAGTFVDVPEGAQIIDCGNYKSAAVTHTSNIKKSNVHVDWEPPAGYEGSVIFLATAVYNYSTFWVGVESLPVQVSRRPYSPNSRNDPQLSAALLSTYHGCGITKTCLSYPENCITQKSCEALVSITPDTGSFQIEMFSSNARYVAVGFSEDMLMGEDSVTECAYNGVGVNAYRSWNEPGRKLNTRLNPQLYPDSGVTRISGLYADGTVYCKIRVEPVTYVQNKKFDLNNNQYYLLLASGKEVETNGVGYHDKFTAVSKTKRSFTEVTPEFVSDPYYDGCGTTKTCFGAPEGCINKQNCAFASAVAVKGNRFIISMIAKSAAAYVATGLSDDKIMADDKVIECVVENNQINAYRSWNTPNRKGNNRLGTNGVQLISAELQDDTLKCTVAYNPTVEPSFEPNRYYYLFLAAGTSVYPESVGYHNLVKRISDRQISLGGTRTTESFYSGCGRTKTCFGNTDSCINQQNCKMAVAMVSRAGSSGAPFEFNMFAQDSAYVAVGLSDDSSMGEDVVFECVRDEGSGNVIRPYMSWNVPGDKGNNRLRQNYLTLLNSSYENGRLQCSILLQTPTFTVEGKTFDLVNEKYVLLLAAGKSVSPSGVGYHGADRVSAAERRSLADVAALRGASKLFLHLHGSFMIASWIGFASLGIVLARYFKQTWVGSSLCGKDIWFAWHRTFMILVWILTIAGVVLIYLDVGGFVTGPSQTHALLGIATTVLAFIQPLGAAFRPHPDSSRRPIFNWLHWFIGNAAHIIAIVTIFLAVDLTKAELPKWTDWILAGYVAFYVIVHLFLSITGCVSDKSGGVRINSMQMKEMNSGRNMSHQFERKKDAPYSGFRKFIFTLHFLVTIAISAFLILLVVYAPVV